MHAIGLALALVVIGCGTEYTPPTSFIDIYPTLFPVETRTQCNFCHALPPNDKSNGMLSMGIDPATAYQALMATSVSSHCGGMALLVPLRPEESLLWLKLDAMPTCGDRMPLGGTPLTAAQLDLVKSWILTGAPEY